MSSEPVAPVSELVEYAEKGCNRYLNGQCQSRRCLVRGGWVSGPVDYDKATCEEHEIAVALRASTRTPEAAQVESLFPAIAHGDDEHRAWLKEAIDAHFAGDPVPPCRGKGRKEASVDVLVEALTRARTEVIGSLDLLKGLQKARNIEWGEDGTAALAARIQSAEATLATIDAALAQVRASEQGEG